MQGSPLSTSQARQLCLALDITSLILEMDVFFNTGRWLHFTMKLNSIETSVITHRVSLEKSITYKSQTSPIHHNF